MLVYSVDGLASTGCFQSQQWIAKHGMERRDAEAQSLFFERAKHTGSGIWLRLDYSSVSLRLCVLRFFAGSADFLHFSRLSHECRATVRFKGKESPNVFPIFLKFQLMVWMAALCCRHCSLGSSDVMTGNR